MATERMGLVEAAEAIGRPRKALQRWRKIPGAPFDADGAVDLEELRAWATARGLLDRKRGRPGAHENPPPVQENPPPEAEGAAPANAALAGSARQSEATVRALVERLNGVNSPEDFFGVLREIAMGAVTEDLPPRKAKILLEVSKQALVAIRKTDRTVDVLATAIDVLTPQERKLVDDHRRSLAMPPLQPGETPPPPLPTGGSDPGPGPSEARDNSRDNSGEKLSP